MDGNISSFQFGRVPFAPINGGAVRDMKGADAMVYLVLCAHSNADGLASVGVRRMADLTDLETGSVSRATQRLVAAGSLKVVTARRGIRTTYQIVRTVHPSVNSDVATSAHTTVNGSSLLRVHPSVNGGVGECSPVGYGGVHPRRLKVFTSQPKSVHPTVNVTERTEKQSSRTSAAAGRAHNQEEREPSRDVIAELTGAGVGEPKRSELARLPGITPELVRAARRDLAERGKGTGALVLEIEARAEKAAATETKRRVKAEAAASRESQQRDDRDRLEADKAKVDRWLDALPAEETARLRALAIEQATPFVRGQWAKSNGTLSYHLKFEMRRLHQQGAAT